MNRIREFIDDHLYQVLISAAAVIVILIVSVLLLTIGHSSKPSQEDATAFATSSTSMSASTDQQASGSQSASSMASATDNSQSGSQRLYVDVKGAVKNPGVYEVNANMRVVDAINLAGGFNRSADKKQINLAQRLTDQQVVYIPIKGEIKGNRALRSTPNQTPAQETVGSSATPSASESSSDAGVTTGSTDGSAKVNLNTADKTKLQELNGIGDKKADQIIAYRQSHGQFKSIEDLKNVPGFGDKTFDNLKSSICV